MIDLEAYITSSGRYKDRANSPDLNKAAILYATILLERVNKALKHLGIEQVDVSSGFRPFGTNGKVGGSKRSAHMTGQAIDLMDDKDQSLAKAFTKPILEKFDLYRENYTDTRGKWTNWVHLQTRPVPSGKRIFKP